MNTGPWRLDWPTAGGPRLGRATIKASPHDFYVDEQLELPGVPNVEPTHRKHGALEKKGQIVVSGAGEHLCLRIEKCGDNTDHLARKLAQLSGCKPHDVGFCGLKDRHAVTRQWFSVYRPGMMAEDDGFIAKVRECWAVLSAHRVPRKLRRGEHRANRFEILVTDIDASPSEVEQVLKRIRVQGCPNYFGSQRFGWAGNNLAQAVRMNPGKRRGKNNRDGLYFSAARSWLFNEVLAERVVAGNWLQFLPGEPVSDDVTGPLWGDGG
ncbi:MAG: tRNA pseudouridine(13) synthase TruD, partial [Marinobacter sp.]